MQRWCGLAGDIAAVEADFAGVGRKPAGDQIEERRLAGTVRTDDAERLALRDREIDISVATSEPKVLRGL